MAEAKEVEFSVRTKTGGKFSTIRAIENVTIGPICVILHNAAGHPVFIAPLSELDSVSRPDAVKGERKEAGQDVP